MFQGSASGSASRSASGSASGVPHIPLPFRWWTPQKCIHPYWCPLFWEITILFPPFVGRQALHSSEYHTRGFRLDSSETSGNYFIIPMMQETSSSNQHTNSARKVDTGRPTPVPQPTLAESGPTGLLSFREVPSTSCHVIVPLK